MQPFEQAAISRSICLSCMRQAHARQLLNAKPWGCRKIASFIAVQTKVCMSVSFSTIKHGVLRIQRVSRICFHDFRPYDTFAPYTSTMHINLEP
jgi:hypothetical protein